LPRQIDAVVTKALAERRGLDGLSEHLAKHGLMPLYGFPTQVRMLYLVRPEREERTIDRNLRIAVSEFAPGNQILKDKSVYTSVGLVAYPPGTILPTQGSINDIVELEGGARQICGACGYLEVHDVAHSVCPICGSDSVEFRLLVEPQGFRTNYDDGATYDWEVERVSRSQRARIASVPADDQRADGNAQLSFGAGNLYVINDNGGFGFTFCRLQGDNFDLTDGRWEIAFKPDRARTVTGSTNDIPFALTCRTKTEVLVVSPSASTSAIYDLEPRSMADPRWAAWVSFAHLFAIAAAKVMMIDRREFDVDAFKLGAGNYGVFLADALDNGAGFARNLFTPVTFAAVMREITENLAQLYTNHEHAGDCDSSCYQCLRDYTNMSWHDVFDWRLGLELASILSGDHRRYSVERNYVERAVRTFAEYHQGWERHETAGGIQMRKNGDAFEFVSCFDVRQPNEINGKVPFEVLRSPAGV
jgi:hypothetical protein